jgi:NAD(P)-dependent dehydrogenase (short-subunit alcohol dehydrogenase family)
MSSPEPQKVAVITGASQGIGAGLVDGFRRSGYAVVGTARSIHQSDEPGYLTVEGDITQAETADHVVEQALDRFGRIDSLINNAGVFIGKPFIDYTVADFAAVTSVNLEGFFHITQRVIRQMVQQGGGHVVNVSTSLVDHADSKRPSALTALTKGGQPRVREVWQRLSSTAARSLGSTPTARRGGESSGHPSRDRSRNRSRNALAPWCTASGPTTAAHQSGSAQFSSCSASVSP